METPKRIENTDVWFVHLIFAYDSYYFGFAFVPVPPAALKKTL